MQVQSSPSANQVQMQSSPSAVKGKHNQLHLPSSLVKSSGVKSRAVVQAQSSKNQVQFSPSAIESSVIVQVQVQSGVVKCSQGQVQLSADKGKCS